MNKDPKTIQAKKIWLSRPHMGGEELKYVHEAYELNWIAPAGDNVNGFEQDLQSYVGMNAAGVFTSGTAAIHLALILMGVKPGDEVLCQSFTFTASANPVTYLGASPVFIDSETDTWNMDPALLEQAIQDRLEGGQSDSSARLPKAIIAVDLFGMPAKMQEIREIGARYKIPVIEDAAEALGSQINGKKCGSFGDVNVLSFNGNKIITTSGGGALLSNNKELIERAKFLASQAKDNAPHYEHTQIGYNYRMSNILAGIGRGQMEVLNDRIRQRREVHDRYFEALGQTWLKLETIPAYASAHTTSADLPPTDDLSSTRPTSTNPTSTHATRPNVIPIDIRLQSSSPTGIHFLREPDGFYSNRWLTTIIINPNETGGVTREDVRLALERENIESRPLWKPMHQQPIYQQSKAYITGVSDWLFEYGLCLPSSSDMTLDDQARVISAIRRVLADGRATSNERASTSSNAKLQEHSKSLQI